MKGEELIVLGLTEEESKGFLQYWAWIEASCESGARVTLINEVNVNEPLDGNSPRSSLWLSFPGNRTQVIPQFEVGDVRLIGPLPGETFGPLFDFVKATLIAMGCQVKEVCTADD